MLPAAKHALHGPLVPSLRPLSALPLQEPSAEVVACINNGEDQDQDQESAQEDERQMGLDGKWQEGGNQDLAQLDHFMASEWGTD